MSAKVLAFMAHPDDVEFTCAGTLLRLKNEAGCRIAIATATSGDCGSISHRIEEITRIRYAEAARSAGLLEADYYPGGSNDLFVFYDEPTLRRFVEVIRKAAPDIVITCPPTDYMLDHEMTGVTVRAACFGAPIPNFWTRDPNPAPPLKSVPHLYYVNPVEDKDIYGRPFVPEFVVDVTGVQSDKEKLLACHASQREWLRAHHGIDEYLEMMRRNDAARGQMIGTKAGEAFSQHLGHGYPSDNILAKLLKLSV